MKALQIDIKTAQRLYPNASAEFKTLLEENFSKKELQAKITDRIKTYKDACEELGRTPLDENDYTSFLCSHYILQGVPANRMDGLISAEISRHKIEVITEALNEGVVMDWNDGNQKKWYPWFNTSSGFAFDVALCRCSAAHAGIPSRLCFKSDELAAYAGRQFTDLYKTFMLNK